MNRRRFAATMLQGLASVGLIGVIGGPTQSKPVIDAGHQQEGPILYKLQEVDNVGYNRARAIPSRRGRRYANYNYQEKNFSRLRQ